MKSAKDLQALFDAIKDENGNLSVAREAFEVRDSQHKSLNGSNLLLTHLHSAYRHMQETRKVMTELSLDTTFQPYEELLDNQISKEYCLEVIPILMSLRDKDGKPIISQENIGCFPKTSPFASVIRNYGQTETPKFPLKTGSKKGNPQRGNYGGPGGRDD